MCPQRRYGAAVRSTWVRDHGLAYLAVVSLTGGVVWLTQIPEGSRPTITLDLGAIGWIVFGVTVIAFLAGSRLGFEALVFLECAFLAVVLFLGASMDIRAVGGVSFGLLSLGVLLAPPVRRRHLRSSRR